MTRRRIAIALGLLVVLLAAGAYYVIVSRPAVLVLTGIVTTNDVIVSPQIGGQIGQLLVKEGDTVKRDQLARRDRPGRAARRTAPTTRRTPRALTSQVQESEAALRYPGAADAPTRSARPSRRSRRPSRSSAAAEADLENGAR